MQFQKRIGPSPEVPVGTLKSFSAEIWVKERAAFVFQLEKQRYGDKATFCVPQSTLQQLEPNLRADPTAAFDALRPLIYWAALARMRETAGMMHQHVLTAHELMASQPDVSLESDVSLQRPEESERWG